MEPRCEKLLKKAIDRFNPDRPLTTDEELERYYVTRLHDPLEKMKAYLQHTTQQPVKLLFSGHMGCGKSTELNRLSRDLRSHFLVIHVTARQLNRADLSYLDVLLACTAGLFRKVSEPTFPVEVDPDLIQDTFEWFSNEVIRETTITHGKATGMMAKVNLLFANLQGKYAGETSTRKTVRDRLDVRVKDMIDRVNALCSELEERGHVPLILFEDLDKANL